MGEFKGFPVGISGKGTDKTEEGVVRTGNPEDIGELDGILLETRSLAEEIKEQIQTTDPKGWSREKTESVKAKTLSILLTMTALGLIVMGMDANIKAEELKFTNDSGIIARELIGLFGGMTAGIFALVEWPSSKRKTA